MSSASTGSFDRRGPGIRTRFLLLISLALIIAGTAASSLLIIRYRMQRQVRANLGEDLQHSVETFQDLEALRLAALNRENALLAALPSLKALMTTNDPRTIADDAGDFWKISGNDLFALTDADSHLLAVEAQGVDDTYKREALKHDLQSALGAGPRSYLLSGGRLFEYGVHPLYFGSSSSGTLLGYVISGFLIDQPFLREVGRGAGAEAAFVAGDALSVSTLPTDKMDTLRGQTQTLQSTGAAIAFVGQERFLMAGKDLSNGAGRPLQLVVLKSFAQADRAEREVDRVVFFVSLFVLVAGSILMLLLARMLTRPLEMLTTGVRAFGKGDKRHTLPTGGTQEVRYLSRAFAQMRDEIQATNRALLESERLATIGRMASSVSHDLRHYLAAVYANSEFLASPTLPAIERAELFEEIRLAVNGTTDMLDSLLTFSRTGAALQRVPTTMTALVERAIALVRTHPDAVHVSITFERIDADTSAALDIKQIERALYNLLLNACQSANEGTERPEVRATLQVESESVSVTIIDSGPGVAEGIRDSLFDPFVSRGKQKGTGLGLTLAWSVAREHDGEVKLVSSVFGETVFRLTVARHLTPIPKAAVSNLLKEVTL